MRRPEIVVDERGRTSLARVRKQKFERYAVEEFPDGTLVLTPLVTVLASRARGGPVRTEEMTA